MHIGRLREEWWWDQVTLVYGEVNKEHYIIHHQRPISVQIAQTKTMFVVWSCFVISWFRLSMSTNVQHCKR